MRQPIFVATLLLSAFISDAAIVKTDPVLTGAITAQTIALNKVYDERKKKEEAILLSEETTNYNLEKIHKVEKQALEYLSNAQGAVQNLYQIKQATELVSVIIPHNIKALSNSIPQHLMGTAVSALVSEQIKRAYSEMASLFPYMQQLVTSGTYDVSGSNDKKSQAHKVNLLNSSERYFIAQEVVNRLNKINRTIVHLTYEVQTLGVKDCVRIVDPLTWQTYNNSTSTVNDVVNTWKKLKK